VRYIPQPAAAPAAQAPAPTPATPAPAPAATSAEAPTQSAADDKYVTVKSPIIGTFYRKPAPDKPVFVEVGDSIKEGDTLCIIEAMKLFNEIESEVSGTIVKVLIDDSSPVEFDQPLFLVDPS
jgi:acetyl-CoA carboxylase biotin carboxyl carrier protein